MVAVEQLVAEAAVEAAPVRDGVSDELRSVIEADEAGRHPPLGDEPVEDPGDVVGVVGAVDLDGEAFAGDLVDHVKHLEGAAFGGCVELEVERP